MSAQDNLSPQQFMSTADVGRLKSDLMRMHGGGTVEDWRKMNSARGGDIVQGKAIWPHAYDVRVNGVRDPVKIVQDELWDGHHRYEAAVRYGHEQMPVERS